MIRYELRRPGELGPHLADLRRLERGITYPLGDGADRFAIDHGEAYHPFFARLGEAYFLLALDGREVVGALSGVLKPARVGGVSHATAYLCDLKLAPSHRGRGLARAMLWRALGLAARRPELRRWRLAYAAAMRGERGDVMRSARGAHAARLARPWARLRIWFADPRALAALPPGRCPPTPGRALDLSPDAVRADDLDPALGLVSTAGRKDLRLQSTGQPWPLVHLASGPDRWRQPRWGDYLREAGARLAALRPDALACFALDERLDDHARWLGAHGLTTDTRCTVYALRLPGGPPPGDLVHLATSEI